VNEARRVLRVHTLIDSLGFGGAEALLADMVAAAPQVGIDATVAYLREPPGGAAATALRDHGTEPSYVSIGRVLDPGGAHRLRRHLRAVSPHIVHTHLTLADTIGTIAARSLHIPSVSTIHLITDPRANPRPSHDPRAPSRARLAAFVRTHASNRVITVSDAARGAYLATGWDTAEHVVTVRNGIVRPPAAPAASVRSELGLRPDDLVVTTVSVLRSGKGHDLAIEAVSRLRTRFPSLRLLILGDGPEREQIRSRAAALGNAVVMAGHRSDVMSVLGATDVLVHPTAMDAFPTALLEAAAAGVPVVATRVGGIPEIVEDGRSGLLVGAPPTVDEVTRALAQLLGDPGLRKRLGEHARTIYAERFSASAWLRQLRAVYDAVLSE
jgi:glycosyltransferase involved in cell wall biosynthesis